MSSAPVGISSPVISRSARAMRLAIGTPRVRTPTRARSSTPLFRSTISCAIRVRVRPMRSASMTTVGMSTSLRPRRTAVKESVDYTLWMASARRNASSPPPIEVPKPDDCCDVDQAPDERTAKWNGHDRVVEHDEPDKHPLFPIPKCRGRGQKIQADAAQEDAQQHVILVGQRQQTDRNRNSGDRDQPEIRRFPAHQSYTPSRVSFYTRALRPALFALDAERAHDLTMAALRRSFVVNALQHGDDTAYAQLSQRVYGLEFRNPIGLAAGLDKQGTALAAWRALGFGFAEVGTVTPRAQPGNPKPRLFRLPHDRAIINRFGFNSVGAAGVARNLGQSAARRGDMRVGINIGKNKDTPNERAVDDYLRTVDELHSYADYFAINVSSPNTAGLRDLQDSRTLRTLVEQVVSRVAAHNPGRAIPVLVKISPDSAENDLLRSVDAAVQGGAAGVIATNTTVSRPPLESRAAAAE